MSMPIFSYTLYRISEGMAGLDKGRSNQKSAAGDKRSVGSVVSEGVPRAAGRPRSDAVRGAVLDAAYAILLERQMGDFSIDAVALRAGVARTTIYRWWPTKGHLAIESFFEAFRPKLAYGKSGVAGDDFRALVKSLTRALAGPDGRVAVSVLMHAQGDTETQRMFRDQFSEPLRAETSRMLKAGIDLGQFRGDLDIPRVIDATVGAIYFRLLFGHPLDTAWAHALADTLLESCYRTETR